MLLRRVALLEAGGLSVLSALLFYCFFQLNHWLADNLEYSQYINWLFLPGGLRVLLVLVLGFSGALGIVLGSWAVSLTDDPVWSWLMVGNGLISGLTPWIVMRGFIQTTDFRSSLPLITPRRLIGFVLVYAVSNALLHHLFWWLLSESKWPEVQGFLPMTIGDALGALVLLYCLKWTLDRWPLPTPEPR